MPLHLSGEIRRLSSAVSKELGRDFKFASTSLRGEQLPLSRVASPTIFPEVAEIFHTGPVGQAACGLLPPGPIQDACLGLTTGGPGRTDPTTSFAPECPRGTIQVGSRCVDLSALPPGGDPAVFTAGGVVVQGGFGLPAQTPLIQERIRRKCMRGMVLGVDDLCYPKAVLGARSSFRKWKRPIKPPITRRDTVAIRRSAAAKQRVFDLAKDVGLHVAKTAHRKR